MLSDNVLHLKIGAGILVDELLVAVRHGRYLRVNFERKANEKKKDNFGGGGGGVYG